MKFIHKLSTEQKLESFGYGEWVEEPDEAYWEYKGIECKIQRNLRIINPSDSVKIFTGLGHLCGYVKIQNVHQWFEKDYHDIDCNCHGGLTYSNMEEDGFWIGFDCAHSRDFVPRMKLLEQEMINESADYTALKKAHNEFKEAVRKRNPNIISLFQNIYRNIAFVKCECESLVDQMLQVSKNIIATKLIPE